MGNRSLTPKLSGLDAFTFFLLKWQFYLSTYYAEYPVLWVCDTLGSSISAKLLEIVRVHSILYL